LYTVPNFLRVSDKEVTDVGQLAEKGANDDMSKNFEGIEVGAVTVKWVRGAKEGSMVWEVRPHGGNPRETFEQILDSHPSDDVSSAVVTGQAAKALFDLPYRSETECLEKALSYHKRQPDILLSLGGETFSVYPMKDGKVRNIISSSKCAAGTGEFIVQQFQRMGLSLQSGLEAARHGNRVELATRCSVHCKSDATHKLNKGECSPGDIAESLIYDLAKKVFQMTESAQWSTRSIVLSGGVANNALFIHHLSSFLEDSEIEILPESHCLEAFGAMLFASESPEKNTAVAPEKWLKNSVMDFDRLKPLTESEGLLDYRVQNQVHRSVKDGDSYILGVDAGSTTTKAVLLNIANNSVDASCYLRTLGNPVSATRQCLIKMIEQVGDKTIRIVQVAATGSGREMVSVYLNNCLSYNEILAHARAAAQEVPEVDTVFEIGGQDSKFISFLDGIPVDYAMNEGCSAGTGSFLEESASVDMGVDMKAISDLAETSNGPIAFGERCAAFINTDLRNALQQGASKEDVIAGLVYSVADNYSSRIVGSRSIGENLLFLGGVALNRSVALAMAARTRRRIVVPPYPELMGSVGTALLAKDHIDDQQVEKIEVELQQLIQGEMEIKSSFRCKTCDNVCDIQRIAIHGKSYPFGGLCSKYERQRHGKEEQREGRDMIAMRNKLMFEEFGSQTVENPRGTIGLPMALTAYELFPFYTRLIAELGYEVVLSEHSKIGNAKTASSICYPCEIAHGAVYDLLEKNVDYVLVPNVIELEIPPGNIHSYTCPSTTVIADIVKAAFKNDSARIVTLDMSISDDLIDSTLQALEGLDAAFGLPQGTARTAGQKALSHYRTYREKSEAMYQRELKDILQEPTVVLAGRPYTVYSSEVNLALPRKITSRGYHVIAADMLPQIDESKAIRDVWHFTQQIGNAISHVKETPNLYICLVSCFSCGPDSVMYHSFRQALAGQTFCYLERDSHTAHAGFETRIGAFLDIIEERNRKAASSKHINQAKNPNVPITPINHPRARFSEDLNSVIDSDGKEVEFDNPRIVHVLTDNTNHFTARMTRKVYADYGRKCRVIEKSDPEAMQMARQICSGRECIPMTAMAGEALKDIQERQDDDEITFYFSLDQQGPCQNGAWPEVWETFVGRLNHKNFIGGINLNSTPNHLGLEPGHVQRIGNSILLGDFFSEAQNTIKCLAVDKEAALIAFENEFAEFLTRFSKNDGELENALDHWSEKMAVIPLKAAVEKTPKVLIFGGLNLAFVHFPVTSYFINQGILPKTVDVAEGITWIESENMIRLGFKHGYRTPAEQFTASLRKKNKADAVKARVSRLGVQKIDAFQKKTRELMARSGLLFDHHIAYSDIIAKAHPFVSNNSFTETAVTTGRYLSAVEDGLYDGLVNLGSFNCQPAMNSQAIIRALASQNDTPYIAIDCEGPWLSANQQRLLETLSVQAKRSRENKS